MSDVERMIGAFILFSGVIIFSYIIGVFNGILDGYGALYEELDQGDNLTKFFAVI